MRDRLTLVAVGGIEHGAEDARARLDAGATLRAGLHRLRLRGPLWPRGSSALAAGEGRCTAGGRPVTFGSRLSGHGRPRAAVRGDRPAPRPARRLGADRLSQRPGEVRPDGGRGAGPEVAVVKPQSAFFERLRLARHRRARAGHRDCREAARWSCSTSSAATSAPLPRPTPTPTSTRLAARGRRDDREPVPRLRLPAPLVETALAHDAGVFVLALTSNPEGPQVQHARTADGRAWPGVLAVAALNVDADARWARSVPWSAPPSTCPRRHGGDLEVDGPLLVPGIGAQGGTAADVRRIFGRASERPAERLAGGPRRRTGPTRPARRGAYGFGRVPPALC